MKTVLLLGCSTITRKTYFKGIDSFSQVDYSSGAVAFTSALVAAGWSVRHIPAHEIATSMPTTVEGLSEFDAIVISDVGSNTFALSPTTVSAGIDSDRLAAVSDYVSGGGGLLLVGGYFSFAGIDGKAGFGRSAIASILPVEVQPTDDRIERPAGIRASVVDAGHPILSGITGEWPPLLGYNRASMRDGSREVLAVDDAPLLALADVGSGRVATYLSDFAPHWASIEFMEWPLYDTLWTNVVGWVAKSAE